MDKLDITDVIAVNSALERYFDVEPYRVEYKVDEYGRSSSVRVASDVPHLDGFCARYGVSMEELEGIVEPRVASLCRSRMKHVMVVNGLHGLYENGPWSLTMKNLAGWAERSESRVVGEVGEIEPERLERALQFLLEKKRREVVVGEAIPVVDVSARVVDACAESP